MKALWLFLLLVVVLSCERSDLTPTPTSTPEPTATVIPTSTPTPTSVPQPPLGPGVHKVGTDIRPGVYAGHGKCAWSRTGTVWPNDDPASLDENKRNAHFVEVAGNFYRKIASSGARSGTLFYVEVQPDDTYFETDCEVTPLANWPVPDEPHKILTYGNTYLVGRDILPGVYYGYEKWNGADVFHICPWTRLRGVTGESSKDNIEDWQDNSRPWHDSERQRIFYVEVQPSDYALHTSCVLTLTGLADVPTPTPTPTAIPWPTREPLDLATTNRAPLLVVLRNDSTHGITIEAVSSFYIGRSHLRLVVDDYEQCSNRLQRFYANAGYYRLSCPRIGEHIRDHETVKQISAFVRKGTTKATVELMCEKNQLSSMWKSVFACNWVE